MDDLNTNTSLNDSLIAENITTTSAETKAMVDWIIICVELFVVLVAICAVFVLVKNEHITPVYIINLLLSDLIQLLSRAMFVLEVHPFIFHYLFFYGILTSVGFMVCISLERYLAITKPLWFKFKFKHNIKSSVLVCLLVWAIPLLFFLTKMYKLPFDDTLSIFAVAVLLPLPLLVFFLVGSLRVLSSARRVSHKEKKRIVSILIVVLLIYTLLFLPFAVFLLLKNQRRHYVLSKVATYCVYLSPLADVTLYVLVRKDAANKILTFCRCAVEH